MITTFLEGEESVLCVQWLLCSYSNARPYFLIAGCNELVVCEAYLFPGVSSSGDDRHSANLEDCRILISRWAIVKILSDVECLHFIVVIGFDVVDCHFFEIWISVWSAPHP